MISLADFDDMFRSSKLKLVLFPRWRDYLRTTASCGREFHLEGRIINKCMCHLRLKTASFLASQWEFDCKLCQNTWLPKLSTNASSSMTDQDLIFFCLRREEEEARQEERGDEKREQELQGMKGGRWRYRKSRVGGEWVAGKMLRLRGKI